MRRHIPRALIAAAATGGAAVALSLATVAPAGAAARAAAAFNPSGGPPVASATQAGYVASGRDFRYAQALITVPDTPCFTDMPSIYVGLQESASTTDGPSFKGDEADYAVAGIQCEFVGGPNHAIGFDHVPDAWDAFVSVAGIQDSFQLTDVSPGDAISVSVYREPSGNGVQTVITLPDGTTYNNTLPINGQIYTRAVALADWSDSDPSTPVPPEAKFRLTQFLHGGFTTLSGQRGTFSGPWTLTASELTSNGVLPPGGSLVYQPSYLWTDGAGGQSGDAFGIWGFPI